MPVGPGGYTTAVKLLTAVYLVCVAITVVLTVVVVLAFTSASQQ